MVDLPKIEHRVNSEGEISKGEMSDACEDDPGMALLVDSGIDEETIRTRERVAKEEKRTGKMGRGVDKWLKSPKDTSWVERNRSPMRIECTPEKTSDPRRSRRLHCRVCNRFEGSEIRLRRTT